LADFEIIECRSDLETLAQDLLKQDVIAVDTEADSFYHYFDKTCLVQIATRKKVYLVDPLSMGGPGELAPLGPVFASPDVRLLLHAAEYDIYVLKRDCGFHFSNLFDTMISAQLLGYPSVGLAALIEHHFGVKVPKDEQRSDWSRRPLTAKQLTYAAGDVIYLVRLAQKLEKELRKAGRLEWAQQEFQVVTGRKWPEREFATLGYLRIKGARKLSPQDLSVLHQLYLMREARAREVDRPPFKVLGNRTLLEIAELQPQDLEQLGRLKGITDLIIRRMGNEILSTVRKGAKKTHGPLPRSEPSGRKRMDHKSERAVTRLKRWRASQARELKMDPGVLCPNSALEAIACANPMSRDDLRGIPELKAWFVEEFGDDVSAVVQQEAASKPADEPAPATGKRKKSRRKKK
jgi:ribonuclease D